jgi:hypothetical protein
MVRIKRGDLPHDFTCPRGGTSYEVIWQFPARDSGPAQHEECNQIMRTRSDTPIPFFRVKTRRVQALTKIPADTTRSAGLLNGIRPTMEQMRFRGVFYPVNSS